MRGFSRNMFVSVASSFVVLSLGACSSERVVPPAPAPLPAETTTTTASPPAATAATERELSSANAGTTSAREGRDPFEPSSIVTTPPTSPKGDVRPRKSKRFGIEELKLVGIVSDSEKPRAMLVDPRGKGWVVTRGELIGRPEVLHDREGDHAVSWRVDRIRESDVILVREDAAHSIAPPSSTRVLALRHDPVIADDAELDD